MKQPKQELKSYFETNDKPTEQQFSDLIDSYHHIDSGSVVTSVVESTDGNKTISLSDGTVVTISNDVKSDGKLLGYKEGLIGNVITPGYGKGKITFTNGSNVIKGIDGINFDDYSGSDTTPFNYGEITIILPDGNYRYVSMDDNTSSTDATIAFVGDVYDENGMNNLSTTWDQPTGDYNWFPFPVGRIENGNDFGVVMAAYGGVNQAPGGVLMGDANFLATGANYSMVQGRRSQVLDNYSVAIGDGLIARRRSVAEFGKYNIDDTDGNNQRHFGVGVGSSDTNRKQGLEVRADGLIYNPEGTNALIDAASGKVVPNKDWVLANQPTGGTSSGLEAIDEGNGIGWRLISKNPNNYGNIGQNAVDLSQSTLPIANGARGSNSLSMGSNTVSSGNNSIVSGDRSNAIGTGSVALGLLNTAGGNYSVSLGRQNNIQGENSSGTGYLNTVLPPNAHAMGFNNRIEATANFGTALGENNIVRGINGFASGMNTVAESFNETVMGIHSTTYTPASRNSYVATDRLVVVGNGGSAGNESDAFTIYKNGAAQLHPITKTSVTNPQAGMMIMDSDDGNALKFYDGTAWQKVSFVAD